MTAFSHWFACFRPVESRVLIGTLILLAGVLACGPPVEAGEDKQDLPFSVKRVLREVQDLMVQKAYTQTIDKIKAFQAKAGEETRETADSEEYRHPMVYYALGNCYLLQGDYTQAQKALSAAVEGDPGLIDAWLNLAKTCYELKQFVKAATCYQSAYERSDPHNPDYLYFCAVSYLMAEQYTPSIAAFEKLFSVHNSQIKQQWQENYAHALLAAGKPREALPVIKTLAMQSKGDDKTRWQETLLHLYLQLDMTKQALHYATDLTREDCLMAKWWKALAHVQLSLGQYKEALAGLTIYGYLTPLSNEEQKLWADLNMQLDIPVRAAPVYERLFKERPDKGLLKNLVIAYQRLGRPDEALKRLEAYSKEGRDSELCMLEADMLFEMKRFRDANRAYCRAARAGCKDSGRAWLLAGYAAWQAEDVTAGKLAFEKAAKYKRQKRAALTALAQLRRTSLANIQ